MSTLEKMNLQNNWLEIAEAIDKESDIANGFNEDVRKLISELHEIPSPVVDIEFVVERLMEIVINNDPDFGL